jgi:hypothetical protein
MSPRTVAVLVAVALLVLGVGGALWAVDALRAPEPSSVELIELGGDEDLDERDGTDKQRKDRRRPHKGGGANRDGAQAPSGGSDDSSGGAPVVPPPSPEKAGDDDGDGEDVDD